MRWKSAPVRAATHEAKQWRWAQAQLSLTRAKRSQPEPSWSCWAEGSWAEPGRVVKSSSARSGHLGSSPASEAMVPHNTCYLALRGLSCSFFPCCGRGEPAVGSSCHLVFVPWVIGTQAMAEHLPSCLCHSNHAKPNWSGEHLLYK